MHSTISTKKTKGTKHSTEDKEQHVDYRNLESGFIASPIPIPRTKETMWAICVIVGNCLVTKYIFGSKVIVMMTGINVLEVFLSSVEEESSIAEINLPNINAFIPFQTRLTPEQGTTKLHNVICRARNGKIANTSKRFLDNFDEINTDTTTDANKVAKLTPLSVFEASRMYNLKKLRV